MNAVETIRCYRSHMWINGKHIHSYNWKPIFVELFSNIYSLSDGMKESRLYYTEVPFQSSLKIYLMFVNLHYVD